jgi:hypothetical protein
MADVVWQLFGTYVMMQLFTAVILENFHDLAKGELSVLPMNKLSEFVEVWTELDPHALQMIGMYIRPVHTYPLMHIHVMGLPVGQIDDTFKQQHVIMQFV